MNTAEKVQHVTKKSSDELLRKFAEVGHSKIVPKKKNITKRVEAAAAAAFVERRSLLTPPAATRKTALLRQIGMGGAHIMRTRNFRNKSLLGTIEKVNQFYLKFYYMIFIFYFFV